MTSQEKSSFFILFFYKRKFFLIKKGFWHFSRINVIEQYSTLVTIYFSCLIYITVISENVNIKSLQGQNYRKVMTQSYGATVLVDYACQTAYIYKPFRAFYF